jgi:hypothetical protein
LERLNAVEPSWIGEMRCKVECGNAEQTAINRRRLQKATETAFWLWLTGKRQSDDEAVVDGASNVNSRQRWREIIQLGSMEMC